VNASPETPENDPIPAPPRERFAERDPARPVPPAAKDFFDLPAWAGRSLKWYFKQPSRHPLGDRRIWLPLVLLVSLLSIPFLHLGLRGQAKITTSVPFEDRFDRTDLGSNYFATGGFWRILDGWLYSPGVKNNPLWLQAALPRDVVVEVDVRAESTAGDVKCEIFGNGRDHSSGYILVFGGWNNTISALARLDEHGADRKENRTKRVEKGRVYHWTVVRKGRVISWYIDGQRFLEWDDPAPLEGPGHDRFGFGTWATDGYFDNLVIKPWSSDFHVAPAVQPPPAPAPESAPGEPKRIAPDLKIDLKSPPE
jgi:hypothetical protein